MICLALPQPDDRAAIEALYVSSLRANPQGFIQDLDYHGNISDLLQGYMAGNGHALVLKDGDHVIGFGALRRIDETSAELCKLHLHSDWHGRKLGRQLSEGLIAAGRDLKLREIELHVTVTQNAALQLYAKLGFVPGERRVYEIAHKGEILHFDTQFMSLAL